MERTRGENMNKEKIQISLGQFKLTSGDTVIAEVVDSPIDQVRFYRKVLSIITEEDFEDGINYFILRPYILFQEEINQPVFINPMHIMTMAKPSKVAVKQYNKWWETYEKSRSQDSDRNEIFENISEMMNSFQNENSIHNLYSLDSSGIIRINRDKLN